MRRAAPLLTNVGVVVAVFGLSKLHASQIAEPPYDFTADARFAWSMLLIGLYWVAAYAAGLPDAPRTPRSAVVASLLATTTAALSVSVLGLLVGEQVLPRFVVLGSALVLVPWFVLCVGLATGGRQRALDLQHVVVVAPPEEVEQLRVDLHRAPERHATVSAALSPSDAAPSPAHPAPLLEAVTRHAATVLVLDRAAQADEEVVAQAAVLHERGVRVRTLSMFYDEWLGKLPLVELERVSLMFDLADLHRSRYARVKRLLDLGVAVVGVLALVLAVPVVAVGDRIANRGPLLYRQTRVGRGGRTFEILKFRTMVPAPPGATVNEWTQEDDPRITPFGRILRRTHLDELPQVVNILRGELSVVGPRPEQPHYVEDLVEKLRFYDLRHLVRPGLTGWAQVKYGYAGDERDAVEKLQYDFYYLRHQRIGLDLRIIGRTIRSVVGGMGR